MRDGIKYTELRSFTASQDELHSRNRFPFFTSKKHKRNWKSQSLPTNQQRDLDNVCIVIKSSKLDYINEEEVQGFMKYFQQDMSDDQVKEIVNEVHQNGGKISISKNALKLPDSASLDQQNNTQPSLRSLFAHLDSDSDGYISVEDLKERLLNISDFPVHECDVRFLMDDKTSLDYQDFYSLMIGCRE